MHARLDRGGDRAAWSCFCCFSSASVPTHERRMAGKVLETIGKIGLGLAITGGIVNSALYNGERLSGVWRRSSGCRWYSGPRSEAGSGSLLATLTFTCCGQVVTLPPHPRALYGCLHTFSPAHSGG